MLEGSGSRAGSGLVDPDPGGQKTRGSVRIRIRIRYTGFTVLNVPIEFVIICRQHPVEARAHRTFAALVFFIYELTCIQRLAGHLPRVPGHVPGLRVVQWLLPRGSLLTKEGRQGTGSTIIICFEIYFCVASKSTSSKLKLYLKITVVFWWRLEDQWQKFWPSDE